MLLPRAWHQRGDEEEVAVGVLMCCPTVRSRGKELLGRDLGSGLGRAGVCLDPSNHQEEPDHQAEECIEDGVGDGGREVEDTVEDGRVGHDGRQLREAGQGQLLELQLGGE